MLFMEWVSLPCYSLFYYQQAENFSGLLLNVIGKHLFLTPSGYFNAYSLP
jgi:hypothetical protein